MSTIFLAISIIVGVSYPLVLAQLNYDGCLETKGKLTSDIIVRSKLLNENVEEQKSAVGPIIYRLLWVP